MRAFLASKTGEGHPSRSFFHNSASYLHDVLGALGYWIVNKYVPVTIIVVVINN